MRRFKIIFLFFITLLLSACGSGGGTLSLTVDRPSTANTSGSSKALFSHWAEVGGSFQIDLTTVQFDVTSAVTITAITGQNCVCNLLVHGNDGAGTANFSACAGTYSNCSYFNSPVSTAATYTNVASSLQICAGATNCTNLK